MKYQFVKQHTETYPLGELCYALGVSSSGYHQWQGKTPSAREVRDKELRTEILEIYRKARGRYGHRPVHSHLGDEGLQCGRDRTLRLMKQMGIAGSQAPRFKPLGTDSDHSYGYSPNLLKKNGPPSRCDEVWVSDTTYLRVKDRWIYLATVMDLFSRRILGWSTSAKNDTALVCKALKNARQTRGSLAPGIIHHSDRGSTYAADAYMKLLKELGMLSSMSAKGNCYDNAAMESFFGRFKTSTIRNRVFLNGQELRGTVFEYIELFYNRYRKHSSLGFLSPMMFEAENFPPMGGGAQKSPLPKPETLIDQPTTN